MPPVYILLIIFYVLIWQILLSTYYGQKKKSLCHKIMNKNRHNYFHCKAYKHEAAMVISAAKEINGTLRASMRAVGPSQETREGFFEDVLLEPRSERCATVTLWRGDRDEGVLDRKNIMCQVAVVMRDIANRRNWHMRVVRGRGQWRKMKLERDTATMQNLK